MIKLGWLSPNAELIKCNWGDHTATAEEICEKLKIPFDRADDKLMSIGWAQITVSMLGQKSVCVYWDKFLTDMQKNYLRKMFENSDIEINSSTLSKFSREN